MENKVLSANLEALKRYDKTLTNEILRINKVKSTFELIQNENGEYNLLKNSIPLHCTNSAQSEARKIVEKIENISDKNTIRVVWGLGLGYLADEFISRAEGTVIIYEPDIELLRTVFEIVEFEKNLQKTNVFVTNDVQKLLKIINILSDKETKITVSFLSSYLKLYKNEIYRTAELVERTRGEKQANTNTINKLGPLAAINTLKNLEKIISTPLVSSLKNTFEGQTALIASAGPSLKENIDIIKKYRNNFILFAVGPSMKLLKENNIEPDFLCVVEALDTSAQLDEMDLEKVNLIFEPYSSSYLWDKKVKNKFLFFSKDNFLNDILANTLKINISDNKAIGTVSYCAVSSAKIMGFKKIVLCGQDLAFRNGECYAKGSAYEDLECVFNAETNKYEIRTKDYEEYKKKLLSKKYLESKYADYYVKNYIKKLNSTIYSVMGQDGKMLPTQACYAIFIKYFEEFARKNKDINLLNASLGGAEIRGFKNMPLQEAICNDPVIQMPEIPHCKNNYDLDEFKKLKKEMLKIYSDIKNKINQLKGMQDNIIKELSRRNILNKNTNKLEQKIISSLTIIENYYNLPYVMFLCASYTNMYFDNLKAAKSSQDTAEIKSLYNKNLNVLNLLAQKLQEAINILLDE